MWRKEREWSFEELVLLLCDSFGAECPQLITELSVIYGSQGWNVEEGTGVEF